MSRESSSWRGLKIRISDSVNPPLDSAWNVLRCSKLQRARRGGHAICLQFPSQQQLFITLRKRRFTSLFFWNKMKQNNKCILRLVRLILMAINSARGCVSLRTKLVCKEMTVKWEGDSSHQRRRWNCRYSVYGIGISQIWLQRSGSWKHFHCDLGMHKILHSWRSGYKP